MRSLWARRPFDIFRPRTVRRLNMLCTRSCTEQGRINYQRSSPFLRTRDFILNIQLWIIICLLATVLNLRMKGRPQTYRVSQNTRIQPFPCIGYSNQDLFSTSTKINNMRNMMMERHYPDFGWIWKEGLVAITKTKEWLDASILRHPVFFLSV